MHIASSSNPTIMATSVAQRPRYDGSCLPLLNLPSSTLRNHPSTIGLPSLEYERSHYRCSPNPKDTRTLSGETIKGLNTGEYRQNPFHCELNQDATLDLT